MTEDQNISNLIKIIKECLEEDGDILYTYLYLDFRTFQAKAFLISAIRN